MPDTPLRLGRDDLFAPHVDQFLEERESLRRAVPETPRQPWFVRLFYSSVFYLSIAGGLGALLAWALLEPFFDEAAVRMHRGDDFPIVAFLMFPTVAAGIGLLLGAVEGIMSRNALRAFISGLVGLGVGFAGGVVSLFAAGFIFAIMQGVALQFW